MTLFNLNYLLKDPISSYSHIRGEGFNSGIGRGGAFLPYVRGLGMAQSTSR